MTKRMLIDATHREETRVAVVEGNRLEDFDFEIQSRKQLKGNIYLAKVTRVEPSLQAAFVEYGGNRHGFLPFPEIHPDYYRIPVEDREAMLEAEAQADDSADEDVDADAKAKAADASATVEDLGGEEDIEEEVPRRRKRPNIRDYSIQEVVKRRQIMLIQVNKEERGNKGAALTTYLSLPGRYCVLMPNSPRGGGVSRKIANPGDRKRMKDLLAALDVPKGMSVILRTAGLSRNKSEIKRDLDYLLRLWDQIREETLESTAPSLIYEEGNLIKRAVRDLYDRDVDQVLVAGDAGYRKAKDYMKMMIPSHAKKVQEYKDDSLPLFFRYQVESQIDAIHSTVVELKSGGYIVINQTEALVAIDVNSGKATRERSIEETALKTNIEAAEEVARQLRLRDMAGLVVIDFIDMDENRNNHAVERKLKEALKKDRARIQVGRISPFGLLEMSRQRLRPSLVETSYSPCAHCGGTGQQRSVESTGMHVLRALEEEGMRQRSSRIRLQMPTDVALYILNHKRDALIDIETRYNFKIVIEQDDSLVRPNFNLERSRLGKDDIAEAAPVVAATDAEPRAEEEDDEDSKPRRRRGRRGGKRRQRKAEEGTDQDNKQATADQENEDGKSARSDDEDGGKSGGRRRGRRGGRRRRRSRSDDAARDDQAEKTEAKTDDKAVEAAGDDKDKADTPKKTEKKASKAKSAGKSKSVKDEKDAGDKKKSAKGKASEAKSKSSSKKADKDDATEAKTEDKKSSKAKSTKAKSTRSKAKTDDKGDKDSKGKSDKDEAKASDKADSKAKPASKSGAKKATPKHLELTGGVGPLQPPSASSSGDDDDGKKSGWLSRILS